MTHRTARAVPWIALAICLCAVIGCPKRTEPKPVESQPAKTPAPRPAAVPAPSSVPAPSTAPTPATMPVATQPMLPPSTYDSNPPYPVALHVRSPEDKQPGWLRILSLADEKQVAAATGLFPEQNRMAIDTQNVRRLRIHIGHLPLSPRKRIVLHIDDQGIELARKDREFIVLERTPAGVWNVAKAEE